MLKEVAHTRILKAVGAHSLGIVIVMMARLYYRHYFYGLGSGVVWRMAYSFFAVLYLLLADMGGKYISVIGWL